MQNSVFITATDTDAGKTWVTYHLLSALLEQRKNIKAIKPVACGLDDSGSNEDIKLLLKAQGLQDCSDINCYGFAKPAAPSIAAQAEGQSIQPEHLLTWCKQQSEKTDLCLIEGIGGLMVPLTTNYLVSDWLADMPQAKVILVVGTKLGCINHALLSLAQLSRMGREPDWVIINNHSRQNAQTVKDALSAYIPSHSRVVVSEYNQPEALLPIAQDLFNTISSGLA